MYHTDKYYLVPAQDAARYETVKQLEAKSVLEHAEKLEQKKEKALSGQVLPLDLLLKKYTDELQKYQAFIKSLQAPVNAPPPPPPSTQDYSDGSTVLSSEVSSSIADEDYEKPNFQRFPKSRREQAAKLFDHMTKDPSLKLVGTEVYMGDKNLGSARNIISFFVQQRKDRPSEGTVRLAKHWAKERRIDVENDIENPKLKSVLSPQRSPFGKSIKKTQAEASPSTSRSSGTAWLTNPLDYVSSYRR